MLGKSCSPMAFISEVELLGKLKHKLIFSSLRSPTVWAVTIFCMFDSHLSPASSCRHAPGVIELDLVHGRTLWSIPFLKGRGEKGSASIGRVKRTRRRKSKWGGSTTHWLHVLKLHFFPLEH